MAMHHQLSDFRTQIMGGTRATYRVIEMDDSHALVQTVDVPGLPAGMRMRITRDAVAGMIACERPVFAPASPRFARHAV